MQGKCYQKSAAYLTVYLALTMTVLLSLCFALIEGVRCNAVGLEAECITDIGLNSVFAEYHRELWKQYNLLAIDSSYGTDYANKANTRQHLKKYIEGNLSMEDLFLSEFLYRDFLALSLEEIDVTGVSVYTDEGGAVFRRRAAEAVKDDIGLALLEELRQWLQVVEEQELLGRDIGAEKQAVDREMEELIEEEEEEQEQEIFELTGRTESVDIDFENPTGWLELKRQMGILEFAVSDYGNLSTRILPGEDLVMHRMSKENINCGNLQLRAFTSEEELVDRFLFQEYLLRYMGYYGDEKEDGILKYQMEYLIIGEDCDLDNLRSMAERICLMREAANAVYLFSDEIKCAEAEVLATAIAALIQVPDLAPLLKTSLLLGWAFAESLYDIKVLLAGGKVPLMKDADTWHFSLEGILQEQGCGEEGWELGLSYEDYLRIWMMLTDVDDLTGRAMNVIEADIRQTPGNQHFRLDGCYDRIEVRVNIQSAYGYGHNFIREKGY
ncbi:MAG: hypothetical protein J6C84_04600 [Lachnospiraceae bacterium]|nr:hypothetical protein [Lachnospiraceae bacterium]